MFNKNNWVNNGSGTKLREGKHQLVSKLKTIIEQLCDQIIFVSLVRMKCFACDTELINECLREPKLTIINRVIEHKIWASDQRLEV